MRQDCHNAMVDGKSWTHDQCRRFYAMKLLRLIRAGFMCSAHLSNAHFTVHQFSRFWRLILRCDSTKTGAIHGAKEEW